MALIHLLPFLFLQNLLHPRAEVVLALQASFGRAAPVAQLLDDGDEGVAKFGQTVLGMAADGVDDALLDDAVLHQFLQLLGQHALTGLGHPALQFLRPVGSKRQAERTRTLRAVQQFVDDIGFPLSAHHLDGDTEAATDVYGYLLVVHIDRKGTKNLADYCHFSLNTAKINSIVLRKLSVFRRLAASRNRCNFAVAMKQLKIETKRGVLLDGVLFAADGGADTVLIAITGIHGRSAMPLCSQRTSTRTPSTTTSATRSPPRASTSSTPRPTTPSEPSER